jgi:RNA polymerase sigma factor (sigma-70 family)
MRQYKHPALRQLRDQQVRYAPAERRLEQLSRAEKLVTEILPEKLYPYQFVCYRITHYRSDQYPDLRISGRDLEHDLSLFIQDLSATVPAVPAEEVPEPVFTLEQLSKDLRVSTKTISRWRDRGLVTRWILCDGKRKVGIRQSLLRRFLDRNQERVEKSGRFSQLTETEKAEILRRAKRLAARAPDRFTEICRRIANKLGRSVETIRYTIKKHDQANPSLAIFKDQTGPLDDSAKQSIYSSFRRGFSINALAERYHRTRTSVYRIINEIRAHRLQAMPMDYIPHPSFEDAEQVDEILGPIPGADAYAAATLKARSSVPKDVPPELAPLYEVPLLNREQEAHLFRKMNFLKHQASGLRNQIDPGKARTTDLDRLEDLIQQFMAVKDQLIRANMRLVASIAKRHAGQNDNYFELLSDGNLSLLKAVEKFDFSRGNKFSTYASWAIMKNFARSLPEEKQRRDRFVTGYEEMFDAAPDSRTDEQDLVLKAQRASQQVNRLLDHLDDRERRIIQLRAGLDAERGLTLEQVGKELGITKERVRQLEARTMTKLKQLAREEHVEI